MIRFWGDVQIGSVAAIREPERERMLPGNLAHGRIVASGIAVAFFLDLRDVCGPTGSDNLNSLNVSELPGHFRVVAEVVVVDGGTVAQDGSDFVEQVLESVRCSKHVLQSPTSWLVVGVVIATVASLVYVAPDRPTNHQTIRQCMLGRNKFQIGKQIPV